MLTRPERFQYHRGGCTVTCIVTGEKWQQNCYLVRHDATGSTVLIDPGDQAQAIIGEIESVGGRAARILLTHPHHDHVGAAQELSEHYGLPCELHRADLRLLIHAPMYALTFAKRPIPAITSHRSFEELVVGSDEPQFRTLHTPGHTKGSVCYLFDGFAFTGDTLLCRHIGRTDLPGASADQLADSIARFLAAAPPETLLFPGHGKPWSVGEAREWWRDSDAPETHDKFHQL